MEGEFWTQTIERYRILRQQKEASEAIGAKLIKNSYTEFVRDEKGYDWIAIAKDKEGFYAIERCENVGVFDKSTEKIYPSKIGDKFGPYTVVRYCDGSRGWSTTTGDNLWPKTWIRAPRLFLDVAD